jgi:cellulose synthase/poly-beta-1,6-N-acetylglucosamine synthase-like glycosyltransferase
MIGLLFWLCVGLVVYTYAGYPLALALLARPRASFRRPEESAGARLRPHGQQPALTPQPAVTLLISAYNEEEVIARKLENSLELDYPRDRLQILVAADGSDDQTPEIVRSFTDRGVELSHSLPRRGKMAAINRAMPLARGEIVVFSDANNEYRPEALRELVAPFADPQVGGATGAKVIAGGDGVLGDSEGLYWRYESFIKEQETRLGSCTGVTGEILALRRGLYEPPPDHVINDDFFIAMRLIQRGYRMVYTPRAQSVERVSLSAQDEITRRARIVAGRYQAIALAHLFLPIRQPLVMWQVISHKFLRPLVPLAMLGALLTNLVAVVVPASGGPLAGLRLAPPFNWITLAAQLAFYGLAWLGGRVGRRSALGRALYLPAFLVNSNFAALIGLARYLRQRQTTLWQRVRRAEN